MSRKELNVNIMKLWGDGIELPTIAIELDTPLEYVEKIVNRDNSRIKSDPRSKDCLEQYRQGVSLHAIGQKYGVTRERVRQIIKKQIAFEMGYGPLEQRSKKLEIDTAYKSIVEDSREERSEDITTEKLAEAKSKGLDPQYFDSVAKFSLASGISVDMLKRFQPDVFKLIKANALVRKRRWTKYYDACRICGKDTVKHRGYGYCENCYTQSPEWKNTVKLSYQRNKAARQEHFKKYAEDYYSRPEVIEKQEQEYDDKYFGGNRKLALERDGFKCISCGMKMDVKDASGKPKVRVWHLDDTEDNRLENLGTYDQSCFIKKYGANGKFRLKRQN